MPRAPGIRQGTLHSAVATWWKPAGLAAYHGQPAGGLAGTVMRGVTIRYGDMTQRNQGRFRTETYITLCFGAAGMLRVQLMLLPQASAHQAQVD
jgi:hypothetical protein